MRIDPEAPEGFILRSYAGDDWQHCRDYVRERAGLPEWKAGETTSAGDFIARMVAAKRRSDAKQEADQQAELDLRRRIERATALWNQSQDPRGTLAEAYLHSRSLDVPAEVSGSVILSLTHG